MKIEEAIEQAQSIVDSVRVKSNWNNWDLRTTTVLTLAVAIMQEANTTALMERLTAALELLNRPTYVYDTKMEEDKHVPGALIRGYGVSKNRCTCGKCMTKRYGIEMKDIESYYDDEEE